ncbi:MAG: triose-phosphate isomerase [Candidatus Paceibacteria bacterium]
MAKPLVVGNWKSYVNSLKEGKKLFKDIEKKLPKKLKADVVICPPYPLLAELARLYRGGRIAFGSQDAFYETGAHTGEVSTELVRDTKAKYVILGHAERRARGETDELVAKKAGAALDQRLIPIIAVGESSRDRDGHYLATLRKSVVESLALVGPDALKKVVIAYEPVWAIGAPLPPEARTIRETVIFIRKVLSEKYGRKDALKVRILYGGAVNTETAPELIAPSGADGFLLGRASVDAESFTTIIAAYS